MARKWWLSLSGRKKNGKTNTIEFYCFLNFFEELSINTYHPKATGTQKKCPIWPTALRVTIDTPRMKEIQPTMFYFTLLRMKKQFQKLFHLFF
jgi:hypothetical protein